MVGNNEFQQDALFDVGSEAEPDTIEALDRLDIVRREVGFLPTTRRELKEAYGLLRPVAGVDQPRTLRSVIADYATYARRARVDRAHLVTLHEELAEAKHADRLSSPTEYVHTGLGQLVRYMDLSSLALNKRPADFPFMPLREFGDSPTPDDYVVTKLSPEVAERINQVLASTAKWEAERWVDNAIDDQRHRQDFFVTHLQQIERQYTYASPVRAITRRVLEDLGVR